MRSPLKQGFTLIELLVVIAIISLLATIILVVFGDVKARARDSQRMTDLKSLQTAVEMYYAEHERYPQPSRGWGHWSGHCPPWGDHDTYILGLEKWMPTLPKDPKYDEWNKCYLYNSNGYDYMILAHITMETVCDGEDGDTIRDPGDECNPPHIQRMDRRCCEQPTIAVYSPGAINW